MWAVVPVKQFAGAKQRLAPVLPTVEARAALYAEMLGRVLDALSAARGIDGILVVSGEPGFSRRDVRVVADGACAGQSAAVAQGARILLAEGRSAMLTVPGDLPLATAAEIEQVIGGHERFTIVPSRDGRGTNALSVSPPDLIRFQFGDASFVPHCAAARALGIEPRILRLPGLGLDIDTRDDLAQWRALVPA
jgi:2-phospho-L-lactate guanylyltransferase